MEFFSRGSLQLLGQERMELLNKRIMELFIEGGAGSAQVLIKILDPTKLWLRFKIA